MLFSLLISPPAPALSLHRPTPSLPIRQFADDMRSKDIDDVLTLYTADAVFEDPTGKTFAGAVALRSLYEQVFATYDSDLSFTRKDVNLKGDGYSAGSTAVETDEYQEQLRTRATNTIQMHCGGVVSTWVRTNDGRWQISNQKWTEKSCAVATASN